MPSTDPIPQYAKPELQGTALNAVAAVGETPSLYLKSAASWVVHVIAVGASATITPQGSMDGDNWVDLESAISPSAATVHRGDCVGFPYVRIAVGTAAATFNFGLYNKTVSEVTAVISTSGLATLAEQQSQTTHLATIAGDTTDIETAVELLDDTVFVDDAVFTPATSKVIMVGFEADETSPDSVDEGDAGAARMTLDRRVRVETTNGTVLQPKIDSYATVAINLTTGADQVLVSSAANKQVWVYGFGISVGDAAGQTISFQDEDNVALSGIMEFAQYGGMAVAPSGNFAMPIFKCGTDKDLEVDITGGDADGWLTYAIVSI